MSGIINTLAPVLKQQDDLNGLVTRFLVELQLTDSSKDTYRKALRRFCTWVRSRTQFGRMDHSALLEYRRFLLSQMLSPQTVNSYLTAVKALFSWAEASAIYPNIAAKIRGQRRPKGFLKDALSLEQVRTLLSSINQTTTRGKRDYAIISLMVRTGLRTIEVIRANIVDLRYQEGVAVLFVQGKGRTDKDEMVVLTAAALMPINSYLETRTALRDTEPLFASTSRQNKGKRLTTRTIRSVVKKALIAIGIRSSKVTAHSLRHTTITLALKAGASLLEARMLARHTSIDTTISYAHNLDRLANAPEHKIECLISGGLPQFSDSGSME